MRPARVEQKVLHELKSTSTGYYPDDLVGKLRSAEISEQPLRDAISRLLDRRQVSVTPDLKITARTA